MTPEIIKAIEDAVDAIFEQNRAEHEKVFLQLHEDLLFQGVAYMKDGKRIDPSDVRKEEA